MSLKKHLILVLAPLALLAALFLPTQALAKSGTYVFDEYEALTEEQFNELESMGASYADKYHVGVYLLFTESLGPNESSSSGRNKFARDYFESNNLGVGSNKDGIILAVAVQSRKYVTVKHFVNKSADPFSDDSVDTMESSVKEKLKENKWYEGATAYYSTVGNHLEYFAKNGKQWTSTHIISTIIKAAVTLGVPLIVAYAVTRHYKDAMLTAHLQTEASNYLDEDSFSLSSQSDIFVNRVVTSTPRPKHDDDNDGGGWSDMGDGFSGSGGGDF